MVRRELPLTLARLGLGDRPRDVFWRGHAAELADVATTAVLGGLGGVLFGALVGLLAGLLAAAVQRRLAARRDVALAVRAAVLAAAGLGWLANAAISPRDTWGDVLVMAELGIIGLGAAWWLGGRLAAWRGTTPQGV